MKNNYLNKHDARNVSKSRAIITGKRRVAIDVRVSTEHEQQIDALENQIQWAEELGNDHKDWTFDVNSDLYIERGLSGTTMKKRPEFNRMITLAKQGKYDLIVVREVCRFMRNAKITLNLVDELLDYGVEVYFVNDGIWSRNPDDYFKLTIMAQYAEQESRKTSERVFSGQAVARENGNIFGNGNILGYKMIVGEKSKDSHYEINEEEAETVRTIYNLALKGMGIKKIKHYLEGDNSESRVYKTAEGKTKWYESTIQRILRRPTYMGAIEHFQSVTENPLTHARRSVQKEQRVKYDLKEKIPCIIEPDIWQAVQVAIDSRVNHNFNSISQSGINGVVTNKNVFCRKMRCGCGRRFKYDEENKPDGIVRGTFRCYSLIDDGSQDVRKKRSEILDDDCSIYGIRDWKMNFITLEVFKYLECDTEKVKGTLIDIINKSYADEGISGYSEEDILKFRKEIDNLNNKNERLLDGFEDGIYSKEKYLERKLRNDTDINRIQEIINKAEAVHAKDEQKEKTLKAVQKFIEETLEFPKVNGYKTKVPEALIEAYVNSIKACANNVFEFNIRINPEVPVQIPIKPDDEFNPQYDSANVFLDNSDASLIAEFKLTYDDAKRYTSIMKGKYKVLRTHFDKPITVRIYANL